MFCNNCGKEISENQKFCIFCGCKVEIQKQDDVIEQTEVTCPACGTTCSSGDLFCLECDKKLENINTIEKSQQEQEKNNDNKDNIDNAEDKLKTEDNVEIQEDTNILNDENSVTVSDDNNNKFIKFFSDKKYKIFMGVALSILLIAGLVMANIKYKEYQENTKPFSTGFQFQNGNVRINTIYDRGTITVKVQTEEIIEEWQRDYFNANTDNKIELILKNNLNEQKINYTDITLEPHKPLNIEFTMYNANVNSYMLIKYLLSDNSANISLNMPLFLSFDVNTRKKAFKDYKIWLKEEQKRKELEEIEKRTNFVNIGSTNKFLPALDNSFSDDTVIYEVVDISLSEYLTSTSWDGSTKNIYPKHGYFTTIELKKWNNASSSVNFDFPGALYDNKLNRYDYHSNNYDEGSINPGDSKNGSRFYDIMRDKSYFLKMTKGYMGIYVDEVRKEYCINNSDDLLHNQDKCTKIIINKFFQEEYKEILGKIQQEKERKLQEERRLQEEKNLEEKRRLQEYMQNDTNDINDFKRLLYEK